MTTEACPACAAIGLRPVCSVARVPVNSCMMLDDQRSAREFPTGELRIAICPSCGFMTNTAFDPQLTSYSEDYEESQGCSPRFRAYLAELSNTWVQRYDLTGRRVVELGCGKGEFLAAMIEDGVAHGVGIDPALQLDRVDRRIRERTTWVANRFPDEYATLDADAVVCRHTLEHIQPVATWLRSIRTALNERTDAVVLFELPDALRVLREGAFWDIYYEHCSYFSAGSLDALFRRCGFEPLDLRRTYDDQYLVIEARPVGTPTQQVGAGTATPPADLDEVLAAAAEFGTRRDAALSQWRDRISKVAAAGGRIVLWGASSKAVAFLSMLEDDADSITAAVDINPHKQNRHLAGSGHRVIAPSELSSIRPELVIVMNPTYLTEIARDLDAMRLTTALEAL